MLKNFKYRRFFDSFKHENVDFSAISVVKSQKAAADTLFAPREKELCADVCQKAAADTLPASREKELCADTRQKEPLP